MRLAFIIALAVVLPACTSKKPHDQSGQSNATNIGKAAYPATSQASTADVLPDSAWRDTVDYWLNPVVALRDSIAAALHHLPLEKRDAVFAELRSIYLERANTRAQSLFDNYPFQQWVESSYVPHQMIAEKGFIIHASEGFYYLVTDHKALSQLCGALVSAEMREFLDFRAEEDSTAFSNDAGLLISWDRLAARILWIDDFLKRHPKFVLLAELVTRRDLYLSTYLTGMDNSPVFSHVNRQVEPEVLASYERVVREHPDSELREVVAGYLAVLKESEYRPSQLVYDYWKKYSIESMMGVQPPVH